MAMSNSLFGMPLPRILARCGPRWIVGSHEPITALTLASGSFAMPDSMSINFGEAQ
jgi:hypothetical protein